MAKHEKDRNTANLLFLDTERSIPDYLTDSGHANVLVRRLENYYKNQGVTGAKFWLETEKKIEGGATFHYVRSNLKFKVPKL